MDIVIEILLEVYMELMFLIVPESKRRKKHYIIAVLIACITAFGFMALAFWGVVLIVEKENAMGWLPLFTAIVLSIAQIIFGIILYNKRHKK